MCTSSEKAPPFDRRVQHRNSPVEPGLPKASRLKNYPFESSSALEQIETMAMTMTLVNGESLDRRNEHRRRANTKPANSCAFFK